MKKRRHHYVWQRYLKSWENGNGNLFALINGQIETPNTLNVAVKKDFYKATKLDPKDIMFFRHAISKVSSPILRQMHTVFLEGYKSLDELEKNSPEAAALARANMIENYYCDIEQSFLPILNSALNGDLSFYQYNSKSSALMIFLSTQYFRTLPIKKSVLHGITQSDRSWIPEPYKMDFGSAWNVWILFFAINVANGFIEERKKRKLVLIQIDTSVPFITGAHPIINLHGNKPGVQVYQISLYYPISPRLALFLNEADTDITILEESLTPAIVNDLNDRIFKMSLGEVFSHTREGISRFHKLQKF